MGVKLVPSSGFFAGPCLGNRMLRFAMHCEHAIPGRVRGNGHDNQGTAG
ncbi:MAG: hypothetical protein ABIK28_11175 [Planctomycetota bacterium]